MSERCPTCGQALPQFGGIVADEERGEVRFGGKLVRNLTNNEFTVFKYLLDHNGRVANKEQIFDHLYQLRGEDEIELKIIDVFICKVRKKIEPLGLHIGTVWGRGYHVVDPT